MAKKQAIDVRLVRVAEPLYREIRAVLEAARAGAYRAVNTAMVQAYWHVGRLIVEHEQGGSKRAAYGETVLDDVSQRLTAEFGRGFTATNLRYMRQFYLAFPIHHALRDESGRAEKRNTARAKLAIHHSMFDAHARPQGDNPTIGLILCSKKNEAVAKYSVLSEGKRLFAAKYVKVLPTEAVLKRQIERERRLIEGGRPAKREQN